jgi:cadmium resistance protein CadD (predicted permease)
MKIIGFCLIIIPVLLFAYVLIFMPEVDFIRSIIGCFIVSGLWILIADAVIRDEKASQRKENE